MKTRLATVLLGTILCIAILIGLAIAAEKIKGKIKSVDSSTGAIVITDDNKDTTIIVEDKAKLNKYSVGDKVKAIYDKKDGKNVATDFRKMEGC